VNRACSDFCSFSVHLLCGFCLHVKALFLNAFLQCAPIKTTDLTGSRVNRIL